MEHLPPPIDGHGRHDKVHFYAPLSKHEIYYPQDFFTIPSEYGYDDFQDLLEKGLRSTMKERDANEFLQSWLFFSLLAQVLDTKIPRANFLRSEDNTISTWELKNLISKWKNQENAASEDAERSLQIQTQRYVRASSALEAARRFISKHCSHERMDRDDPSHAQNQSKYPGSGSGVDGRLNSKLTLSLAILGETLQLELPEIPCSQDGRLQFYNNQNKHAMNWGLQYVLQGKAAKKRVVPIPNSSTRIHLDWSRYCLSHMQNDTTNAKK